MKNPRKHLVLILLGVIISTFIPLQVSATPSFYYYTETVDGGDTGSQGWGIIDVKAEEVDLDTGRMKVGCSASMWGEVEVWAYVYKDFYYDGPDGALNTIEIKYHVTGVIDALLAEASIEIYDEFEDLDSGTPFYPVPHPDWEERVSGWYEPYDHDEYTRFDAILLNGHTYRVTLRAKASVILTTPEIPIGYGASDFGGPMIIGERYVDWVYLEVSQVWQEPVAYFTYSPSLPEVDETVLFDASDSYDPDGSITEYAWDFNGDSIIDFQGTQSTAQYIYEDVGSYTATLTVKDNNGLTDSQSKVITVYPIPPVATFTFTPGSPKPYETVHFDASGSYDPDGSIASYFWDFGDGTNGTGVTVNHIYTTHGDKRVILIVTDDDGAKDYYQANVTVEYNHDIVITSVSASPPVHPTKLNIGESVTIGVTVKNEGDVAETFDVTAYGGGIGGYPKMYEETLTVVNLEPEDSTTLTFIWDTTSMSWNQAGYYPVWAVADAVPGETGTNDNTYIDGTVRVRIPGDADFDGQVDMTDHDLWEEYYGTTPDQWPPGIDPDFNNNGIVGVEDFGIWLANVQFHDIAVTDVAPVLPYGATAVYPSWVIDVSVTVKNEGDLSETFTVTAYYDSAAIGTQTVSNLTPDATETLTFIWDTAGVSPGTAGLNYTISAEASVVPDETDTADNTYVDGTVRVKYPGDVDGDGDVDRYDASTVSLAYGSQYGDPNYDWRCDFDGDGDVDRYDSGILGRNYGHLP